MRPAAASVLLLLVATVTLHGQGGAFWQAGIFGPLSQAPRVLTLAQVPARPKVEAYAPPHDNLTLQDNRCTAANTN